jgi:antitoxin (DNA-binding transcriptional repressor) of toxin-antitoxin stability system
MLAVTVHGVTIRDTEGMPVARLAPERSGRVTRRASELASSGVVADEDPLTPST